MMQVLYLLGLVNMYISGWVTLISQEIKSLALAILELYLYKGISK